LLKTLNRSDILINPYTANKEWEFYYSSSLNLSSSFEIYKGTKILNTNINDTIITNGQYEKLVYDSINGLFYQLYPGETLNTQSLVTSLYYESASSQRPTNSYNIYNDNQYFRKTFPTNSGESIAVISINRNIFGNKIKPSSILVNIESSSYEIYDDGVGNLIYQIGDGEYVYYDYVNEYYVQNEDNTREYIGNVFYSHGIIVISKQSLVPNFIISNQVNSGSFILSNNYVNICSLTPTILYYTGSFGEGTSVYYNKSLTAPVTGYIYIKDPNESDIRYINENIVGEYSGDQCVTGSFIIDYYNNAEGYLTQVNNVPGFILTSSLYSGSIYSGSYISFENEIEIIGYNSGSNITDTEYTLWRNGTILENSIFTTGSNIIPSNYFDGNDEIKLIFNNNT